VKRFAPRWLKSLIVGLLLFSSAITAQATSHIPIGAIVINEFVPAPRTVFTQEKIELYNTTPDPVDIGGLWIDDIAGGGSPPRQIPANTIIPGFGFYVHSDSNFLNNSGDDVRLLDTDGVTVLDSYTYTAFPGYDASYYRLCDGGPWATSPNRSPTIGASNGACSGMWTPGSFEIHIFDVKQGDSQLIISPSGKTLLIDMGEPSWNARSGAAYIADKLRKIMGPSFSHVDYIVPSHLHLDHIGNAGYGGIWALLEVHGFTVGKLIDRDAGVWVDSNGDGVCNPDTEIVWDNAGTTSSTARNWLCYATNPENAAKLNREIAVINSTTQIDLGLDVTVKIVERDAENVMMADGVTPVGGDHTADAFPPSENDYSIGVKITFGLLDYATAGDSDGEYTRSGFGYTYNDVEALLAPRIGAVDVMRANHHGSGHSTSQFYADTLQPQASFISCSNNPYGHPGQTTLDRLLSRGAVYITNLCDATRIYGASVIVNGDIVLKSTVGGENFTVNDGPPFTATNPATPTLAPTATLALTDTSTPTLTPVRPAPRPRFAFPLGAPVAVTAAEDMLIENEPGPLYVILSTVDEHGVDGEPILNLMSQPDPADTASAGTVPTGTFAEVLEIRRLPPNYLRTFYRVSTRQSASQDMEGWVADWYARRTVSIVVFDEQGCACPFQVQLWADAELTQPAGLVLNGSPLRLLGLAEESVQVQVLSSGTIGWVSRDNVLEARKKNYLKHIVP